MILEEDHLIIAPGMDGRFFIMVNPMFIKATGDNTAEIRNVSLNEEEESLTGDSD